MNYFSQNWKTTACGLVVILVWVIKLFSGIEVPKEVSEALTVIFTFLGLVFAGDAKRGALMVLLCIPLISGCVTASKWDYKLYESNLKLADEGMKTWACNSGFISGLGLTNKVAFPITLNNSSEAQALLSSPTIALGLADLDVIAKKYNYWHERDFDLCYSLGVKVRLGTTGGVDVIKAFFPDLMKYLMPLSGL